MIIVKHLIKLNPEKPVSVSVCVVDLSRFLSPASHSCIFVEDLDLVRLPMVSEEMELYPLINLFQRGHSTLPYHWHSFWREIVTLNFFL